MTYAPETETVAAPSPTTHTTDQTPAEPADLPLPVVDDPGTRVTRPREVRRQARRRFLQTMGAVGVGVGLAFTDSLSTRVARPAGAAAYELWRDCRNYFNPSTTCIPSNSYFGSDNCDANTWHRNDWAVVGVTADIVLVGIYTHNPTACAGRNAWLWAVGGGQSTKCSDGWREVWRATSTESTLLSSSWSICRTTGFH